MTLALVEREEVSELVVGMGVNGWILHVHVSRKPIVRFCCLKQSKHRRRSQGARLDFLLEKRLNPVQLLTLAEKSYI